MATLNFAHEPDGTIMVRAAWLYHVGGLTQEQVARRLGVHRTRVVRLLADARDRGLISVTINHEASRDLDLEASIARTYGLDFCLVTPPMGFDPAPSNPTLAAAQDMIARRAVGNAAASLLKGKLMPGAPITVGVSWGRTLEQMTAHLSGVLNPRARFVSLMGSLTRNSASNPFEVVQALAARTGGEGHFLPVPFIADSEADRLVLISQRSVSEALALARSADLFVISVGELSEAAFLREQGMLSAAELTSVRARGAVADSLGRLFDATGASIEHELARRTLALEFEQLRGRDVVLLAGGLGKVAATHALLRTGVVQGLVIDGDASRLLAATTSEGQGSALHLPRNSPLDASISKGSRRSL